MAESIHKLPGSVRIHGKSKQLRYHTGKNEPDSYLQPLTALRAGEPLLRGQLVSIAIPSEYIGKDDWNDKEAYAVKTDLNKHEHAIGIALEPVQVGEFVHIQNIGSFTFNAGSILENEYNPDFEEEDIGKIVWASGVNNGKLTLDKDEAIAAHNVIRVGYLLDAPNLADLNPSKVKIDLLITGDLRGPFDITQFRLKLAEPITINEPLSLSDLKIFSLGQDIDDEKIEIEVSGNIELGKYIAIGAFDRLAVISSTAVDVSNNHLDYSDIQYFLLNNDWSNTLMEVFQFLFNDDNFNFTSNGNKYTAIYSGGAIKLISNNNNVIKIIKSGKYKTTGRAVLADIRDETSVVGIYFSHIYSELLDREYPYIFMDKGIFTVTEPLFTAGANYFLGTNGHLITQAEAYKYYKIIKIGKAIDENNLLIDIKQPSFRALTAFPVGHIKLGNGINPSAGYVLCNGQELREKSDDIDESNTSPYKYTQLIDYLLSIYGKEKLIFDDPNADIRTITLPKIEDLPNSFYEIKWAQDNTEYNQLTTIPFMVDKGIIEARDKTININSLINYIVDDGNLLDISLYDIDFSVKINENEWISLTPSNSLIEDSFSFYYSLHREGTIFSLKINYLGGTNIGEESIIGKPYSITIARNHLIPTQYINTTHTFKYPVINNSLGFETGENITYPDVPINIEAIRKYFNEKTTPNINRDVYERIQRLESFIYGTHGVTENEYLNKTPTNDLLSSLDDVLAALIEDEESEELSEKYLGALCRLRKIIELLNNHNQIIKSLSGTISDNKDGFNSDLEKLSKQIDELDKNKAKQSEFTTLYDKVNHATSGLDSKADQETVTSQGNKITTLEGLVGSASSGLVKKVADLEALSINAKLEKIKEWITTEGGDPTFNGF